MLNRHEKFMEHALDLALKARGKTSPNPMVGAVVVKNGRIVGEGHHRFAGDKHAEVWALEGVGRRAKGADLYITLEPCCIYGRTPPCVDKIIASKIKKVFVGTKDPNPKVNGRGINMLKKAGIKVTTGILEEECKAINAIYNKYISTGRPYVVLKVALSLDGKVAAFDGSSRWISNESSRRMVHVLRDRFDAVMVGGGTVEKDKPKLTSRVLGKKTKDPVKIIVDGKLKLSPKLDIFKKGRTIVVTTNATSEKQAAPFKKMGVDMVRCAANRETINIREMLQKLGKKEITSVLVEGGSYLHSRMIASGCVDKVITIIAPKILGGQGKDWLPHIKVNSIQNALNLKDVSISCLDDNVIIEGRF